MLYIVGGHLVIQKFEIKDTSINKMFISRKSLSCVHAYLNIQKGILFRRDKGGFYVTNQ